MAAAAPQRAVIPQVTVMPGLTRHPWLRKRRTGLRVRPAMTGFPYPAQCTAPLHAVASTTIPKAMRYHAKGVKLWVEM